MKRTRKCANIGCDREFKMYRSTDKFCSHQCAHEANQGKEKAKKRYKLKPYSEKRKAESILYRKKRKEFLSKPEHNICPVALDIFNERLQATEIHHMAGRTGKLLNYSPFWLPVSRKAHIWIHQNPEEAYNRGYLIHSSTK